MKQSIRVDIDLSQYGSIEVLKESSIVDIVVNDVLKNLQFKGYQANRSIVLKSTKNAISLLLSRKKSSFCSLPIYIPIAAAQVISDNVVPSASSDDDVSSFHSSQSLQAAALDVPVQNREEPNVPENQLLHFSFANNSLSIDVHFDYVLEYFRHSLSKQTKPMKTQKFIDDICSYVFTQIFCSLHVRDIRDSFSRQISHFVQVTRKRVGQRSVIEGLRKKKVFSFFFSAVARPDSFQLANDFVQYGDREKKEPILLVRKREEEVDVINFFAHNGKLEITFNRTWVLRAFDLFDVTQILDIRELIDLSLLIVSHAEIRITRIVLEEAIKTEIYCYRTENSTARFVTVSLKSSESDVYLSSFDTSSTEDLEVPTDDFFDRVIGRTYLTRGVKRDYKEDDDSSDNDRLRQREERKIQEKRTLLHLKDTFHLTDSAMKALFNYVQSKKKFFSMRELECLRRKTNEKFPITSSKTFAYVKFPYAVRVAVFVARKFQPNIDQLDHLNIRFNMDGTLIGNKHIVAISINCIEGGLTCQSAKHLVPLGLFEVQKENTEVLRQSLPSEFINHIKSTTYVSIKGRDIKLQLRLGGDLMNAVYVFGLSGFSSSYPCVFCTQHKDDLHVTEDSVYEKNIQEGRGKNKKTTLIRVEPTSYFDPSRKARSLAEQKLCLSKGTNELGYKCEPLFGDLFEYGDYCVDTLHMKLRIFDVLLKDMLCHASKTGKYGSDHVREIEKKILILNQHCEKTVGKRFFFQIDYDDQNKTISSHGKLSGHLQDLFFSNDFPYDAILDDVLAKSTRSVVQKFKELLSELKRTSSATKNAIKRLALDFVSEFRKSGLRTTVTPYIHIVGNHLFEFLENSDLSDYNMQGVEKSNDLLSRLYFSSTNPAKNPLLTMLQKLYRMLEMNFQSESERQDALAFCATDVYEYYDDDQEICRSSRNDNEKNGDDMINLNTSLSSDETEDDAQMDSDDSFTWAPERRIASSLPPRSENRFKSFKKS